MAYVDDGVASGAPDVDGAAGVVAAGDGDFAGVNAGVGVADDGGDVEACVDVVLEVLAALPSVQASMQVSVLASRSMLG